MSPAPLLRDPGQQAVLDAAGYAVQPLLDAASLERLQSVFDTAHGAAQQCGFRATNYGTDVSRVLRVKADILAVVGGALDALLQDYRVVEAGFLYKRGPESAVPLHQDHSIVDERRWTNVHVWIPLVDVTVANGTLHVVPGSHRAFSHLRHPTLPTPYAGSEDVVQGLSVPVVVSRGTAVVIRTALVHHSPPNMTDAVRPVAVVNVVSRSAPLQVFMRDGDAADRVAVYDVPDDFRDRTARFDQGQYGPPALGTNRRVLPYALQTLPRADVARVAAEGLARARAAGAWGLAPGPGA